MKWLLCALVSAFLVFAGVSPALATPMNATLRCADLVAAVGSGVFTWASGAQTCSNSNLTIERSTFIAWITNTGSCASGLNATYYVILYGDMLNCRSGGSVTLQTAPGNLNGASSILHLGTCEATAPAMTSVQTGSAVAPVSVGTQVAWQATNVTNSFTLTIRNPSNATVATFTVPASSTSTYTYYATGAAAGVYTFAESGLPSYPCPAIGVGGSAMGTLSWYQ